jgi:hypothetical protein
MRGSSASATAKEAAVSQPWSPQRPQPYEPPLLPGPPARLTDLRVLLLVAVTVVTAIATVLGVAGMLEIRNGAQARAAAQQAWLGHEAVVTGGLHDLQSCGLPLCAGGRYTITVPADAPVPAAGTEMLLDGSAGFFLPGKNFPDRLDFTIGYRDGQVWTLGSGPVGSQHVATADAIQGSRRTVLVATLVALAIGVVGTAGTVWLAVLAARARRRSRAVPATA